VLFQGSRILQVTWQELPARAHACVEQFREFALTDCLYERRLYC